MKKMLLAGISAAFVATTLSAATAQTELSRNQIINSLQGAQQKVDVSADELQKFSDVTGPPIPWETVHCDFHCRICHSPVRVICRMHEFAMSSYRYFPLSVHELQVPRLDDGR